MDLGVIEDLLVIVLWRGEVAVDGIIARGWDDEGRLLQRLVRGLREKERERNDGEEFLRAHTHTCTHARAHTHTP